MLPSTPLRDYVSHYALSTEDLGRQVLVRPVTASPHVALVLHLGAPTEAFEYHTGRTRVLPNVMVVGPQTTRRAELLMRGPRASLVVRFRPGGFHRLFHVSVEDLTNSARDAQEVIGAEAGPLLADVAGRVHASARVRAVERFLTSRLATARPRHPATEAADEVLQAHGTSRIADLVRHSGLSARQFERAFRESTGLSPKLFARAARLEFALQLKRGDPLRTWTQVSHEAGYFDQTHFVKDFKALAGETPSTFPLVERAATALVSRPA
jgi:AraC-like DNA-binding protein